MSPFGYADRPIHIAAFGRTDMGRRRSENQDNFLIADLSVPIGSGGFLLDTDDDAAREVGHFLLGPRGALALVADGMGGAAAGAIASKLAVGWIYRTLTTRWAEDRNHSPQQFATRLHGAVDEANARIHDEAMATPEYAGMGTTATVAGIYDGFLYVAQVGDSRAYLVRRGAAEQVTRDQSIVQELIDSGAMTEDEAENSVHGNLILQALGTAPAVQVELTYQEMRRGDTVLLCSDGLSRMVRKHEIAEAAARFADPAALCDHLIDLANARGGPDNITVVAIRVDGDGLQEPAEGDVVCRRVYDLPDL